MALDVGIKTPDGSADPLERDLVASFNDPMYWFLTEFLAPFTEKTGIRIDQCDDAHVYGVQLNTLQLCILKARDVISDKPEEWEEYVGFEIKPRKDLYERIRKKDILSEVDKLLKLIRRARNADKTLFFFGD